MAASLGIATSWAVAAGAQRPQATLPLDPPRDRGTSITPAYEGWYPNPDGSFSMLIGYYNRNTKESLDIPVGPNNRVQPGDPDQGQPTHFESGRQWGVFVIRVPKDFGNKVITWTIVANGESQSIPFTLNKGYPISPYKELGMGNQPPVLAFSQDGAKVTGPPTAVSASVTGTVNKQGAMISAAATFAAPGEYLLRVQANDESGEGGFGFQCCWTNTFVKVTVRP